MLSKPLNNQVNVPVLGLGTYYFAGYHQADHSHDRENVELIKKAIKLGYTHLDTAERYGAGNAEILIGKAIKGFDRKKLFVTSKVSPENLKYQDIIKSAKQSLKRLQTDYLDLYLIHRPNPKIPLRETMKAMDHLVENGLVKHIGVSNFSVQHIKQAQKWTKNKIAANQIEYNLLVRNNGRFTKNMEKEIIPYCRKNKILVIAWRPLAFGILAKEGLPLLDRIAVKYRTSRAQVAISWLVSKPGIVTLVKSTNIAHLKDNLKFVKFKKEDMKLLDDWKL